MQINRLEHVNIITANLPDMKAWYETILGLKEGYRPPFDVPGHWLYVGAMPIVHLVDLNRDAAGVDPKVEHFALSASGLADFIKRLDAHGVAWSPIRVPELNEVQINIHDPDGNHIHVDFAPEEADAAGL